MHRQIADHHKAHPFTLPKIGDVIISEGTGIAYTMYGPFNEGGFGQIFYCEDEWGHELVAKILKPVGPIEEMEERAESEVIANAIVRSPHIVHVHDAFVFHGAYYIISERCVLSLRELMLGEYNPTIAFTPLCKAMLHALHYMHTRRLVHSDVHEGNVLIHSKPDAFNRNAAVYDFKLGDFGQTRAVENASSRPTWNLSCIPPEVLDSKEFGPIDHRSDIYQAGLLLLRFYTKCTEQFDEVDIHAGKPREIAEGAGSPITSVIAKMLRRHVNHRTQTALEAWREFDAAMKFQ